MTLNFAPFQINRSTAKMVWQYWSLLLQSCKFSVIIFAVLLKLFIDRFRLVLRRRLDLGRLSRVMRLNFGNRKWPPTSNDHISGCVVFIRRWRRRGSRDVVLSSRPQRQRQRLVVLVIILRHWGRQLWVVRLCVPEVGMLERLLCRATPWRVPRQQCVEKRYGASGRPRP